MTNTEKKEDIDRCHKFLLKALDEQFTEFYLKYTQEESNSIYTTNYELDKPYTHLIKTFFTDMLSFQSERNNISTGFSNIACHLNFLPVVLIIKDDKKQGAFWKLNKPDAISKGTNISNFMETFYKNYINKTAIEEALIYLKTGKFLKLMNVETISDISIDKDLEAMKERHWGEVADKAITTIHQLELELGKAKKTSKDNTYWPCRLEYNEPKADKKIELLVVFYVSNFNGTNTCSITCKRQDPFIKESLVRLFRKIFYIGLQLEKNVIASQEHEQWIAASGKEALFTKIHAPLKKIIDNLTNTEVLVRYVDRQLNPPWTGILNLSQYKKVGYIFKKNQPISYENDEGKQVPFQGIHDFETHYIKHDHKDFIDGTKNYFLSLIKAVKKDFKEDEDGSKNEDDILTLLFKLLADSRLTDRDKYYFLRFVKLIIYDIQDNDKSLTFLQIITYTLLGLASKTGGITYHVNNNTTTIKPNLMTVNGMKELMETKLYKGTIINKAYLEVHKGKTSNKHPTVKLSGSISPGEFCAALAGLIGEELQGEGKSKSVTFISISVVSLGKGKHIGITIECSGQFDNNSSVRKIDDDNDSKDEVYHGMRSTLKTIEKAVGAKRKFFEHEPKNLADSYHPFAFFCHKEVSGPVTTIRIILGDIFSSHCSYQISDFVKIESGE